MKKELIIIFIYLLISINSYSQGWIGNSGNNLVGYNSITNLTPLNVGIGTNSPTAVLHTVGDLRFQNLQQANNNYNRLLITDNNGRVRWINLANVTGAGSDNDWLTVGANAIPGNINDNIYTLGNVGINTNNPFAQLAVNGGNNLAFGIRQGQGGINGGMYIDEPASINSARIFMTGNIFKIGRANANNANAADAITLNANGQVGILLPIGNTPTANLHTFGRVRLQNLPTGNGNQLVVDANGNVMVSSCTCPNNQMAREQDEVQELKTRINNLEKEIEIFKNIVLDIQRKEKNFSINNSLPELDNEFDKKVKIYPNPGSDLFTLDLTNLKLDNLKYKIVNSSGVSISKTLTEITIPKVHIDLSGFADGIYYLSIYREGQLFITKKIILNQ